MPYPPNDLIVHLRDARRVYWAVDLLSQDNTLWNLTPEDILLFRSASVLLSELIAVLEVLEGDVAKEYVEGINEKPPF